MSHTHCFRLSDETHTILRRVGPRRQTRYVDSAVRRRWTTWESALRRLHAAGWTGAALLAAADLTRSTSCAPGDLAGMLSATAPLTSTLSTHGVRLDEWTDLVGRLNPALARDLLDVGGEIHDGNTWLEDLLGLAPHNPSLVR